MREGPLIMAAVVTGGGGLLAQAEWGMILWALGWACVISAARTVKEREAQTQAGQSRTTVTATVMEAVLGAGLGLALSLVGPELWEPLRNLAAVTGLAMLGGFMGAPGWALVERLSGRWVEKRLGVSHDDTPKP